MEGGYSRMHGYEARPGHDEGSMITTEHSMKTNLYNGRPSSSNSSLPSPMGQEHPQTPAVSYSLRSESSESSRAELPRRSTSDDSSNTGTSPTPYVKSIRHRPSEASRLRGLNNGYAMPPADGRQGQEVPVLENFSRPRQVSTKTNDEFSRPVIHSSSTFPLQSQPETAVRSASQSNIRDREISTSSSKSTYNLPIIPIRASSSIPDFSTADTNFSRQRNLPTYTNFRLGASFTDNNLASHRREPALPNAVNDEVRASFRSALTTSSSFLGTSGTERSSVMTKSSSTSIFGHDDGMSVDDAIGMYEAGFADSGAEDDYASRPGTSFSHRSALRVPQTREDSLNLRKVSSRIIQDSSAMFSEPEGMEPVEGSTTKKSWDPFPRTSEYSHTMQSSDNSRHPPSRQSTDLFEPPFDDTRDRYGFRKKSQHVSLVEYEAWNGPYTEYLERRRRKWVVLMRDSKLFTDKPRTFPPKSAKVKRFIRKGIPPDWRGAAWFYYAGGPAILAKNSTLYVELLERIRAGGLNDTDEELIERDLHRTFPDNIRFKPDPPTVSGSDGVDANHALPEVETPVLQSLRRVLQAFSVYNPKIGYCQSLNFLAGLLLLFMDEEKSFWLLNIITRVYLPGTHEVNLEGANVDLGVLMTSVKESMPAIWAKIGGELDGSAGDGKVSMRLPPITLCLTAWFMSCFIGTLPIETTLRVWDSFFYEGSKTFFRIALAIFKVGEPEIRAVNDPMEIFQVVQNIPRRLIDANGLMEACFRRRNGFGHLSQDTIESRRAERRAGYAEERARAAGDLPVARKKSVFARKRSRGKTIET